MARRSDHTRDELHEMALSAAEAIAGAEGIQGLTARKVAGRIGYSSGTLYNLFTDLDDLIIRMNARTLEKLYKALTAESRPGDTEEALKQLAYGYIRFTGENARLWSAVFEPSLPDRDSFPDWYQERVMRLLGLVAGALQPLFGPEDDAARMHHARVLWSGIYGMCAMDASGTLAAEETLEQMADSLISNYISGLRSRH